MKRSIKDSRGTIATGAMLEQLLESIRPDASRRLILAAISSFAARGFHATTTRDISVSAGMSPAALYVHYSSKEELLFESCRIAHESALHAIRSSADKQQDPTSRLRSVVRDLSLWHARHTTLARVAQYELGALSSDHFKVIAAIRRRTEQIVRSEIQRGVNSGAFSVRDVVSVARAILSMSIDIARWYRPTGRLNPETLANNYADLAISMVKADWT